MDDGSNPPEARLIPASTSLGRLAGIVPFTGGFRFFDWLVLIKSLLRAALTDKISDRETFMKGIDYSYYYEQED